MCVSECVPMIYLELQNLALSVCLFLSHESPSFDWFAELKGLCVCLFISIRGCFVWPTWQWTRWIKTKEREILDTNPHHLPLSQRRKLSPSPSWGRDNRRERKNEVIYMDINTPFLGDQRIEAPKTQSEGWAIEAEMIHTHTHTHVCDKISFIDWL